MHAARGLVVEAERAEALFELLAEDIDTLTPTALRQAERWCVRGDWTYKGARPVFQLADLYPSPDQLATLHEQERARGYLIITPEEYAALRRDAVAEGVRKEALRVERSRDSGAANANLLELVRLRAANLPPQTAQERFLGGEPC